MKVIFECEKCGYVFKVLVLADEPPMVALPRTKDGCHLAQCPKCSPPEQSYGSLTVEMVADMLCVAACGTVNKCRHRTTGLDECWNNDILPGARCVIRMLKEMSPDGGNMFVDEHHCRLTLLKIAGEVRDEL